MHSFMGGCIKVYILKVFFVECHSDSCQKVMPSWMCTVWVWTLCIYVVRMSPALNGSSAIRCFKGSDVIEICDRITFDLYMGLPHIYCDRLRGDNGCNCAIVLTSISCFLLGAVEASPFPTNDFVVVHCPIHITWESEMGPKLGSLSFCFALFYSYSLQD